MYICIYTYAYIYLYNIHVSETALKTAKNEADMIDADMAEVDMAGGQGEECSRLQTFLYVCFKYEIVVDSPSTCSLSA